MTMPTASPAIAALERPLLPPLLLPLPPCPGGEGTLVGAPTAAVAVTAEAGRPEALAAAERNEPRSPGAAARVVVVVLPAGAAAREASWAERAAGRAGVPPADAEHDRTETTSDTSVVEALDAGPRRRRAAPAPPPAGRSTTASAPCRDLSARSATCAHSPACVLTASAAPATSATVPFATETTATLARGTPRKHETPRRARTPTAGVSTAAGRTPPESASVTGTFTRAQEGEGVADAAAAGAVPDVEIEGSGAAL